MHERHFAKFGPFLRSPDRRFDTVGDVSWLAPPFLSDDEIVNVHQVRNPLKVIRSIYQMGLFDPAHEHSRKPFVGMARKHFAFSNDPLRSAMRFYIEWNAKCEAVTGKRYRIEDLDKNCEKVGGWLDIELSDIAGASKATRRRKN